MIIVDTFRHFLNADTDVSSTHLILLTVSIASEFAVAIGILLETHWPRSFKDWAAVVLVVGGVSIGAICTYSLFQFDETLSSRQQQTISDQQGKIIALERRIAPRDLDPQQIKKISNAMSSYANISEGKERQSAAVFASSGEYESAALADKIAESLGPGAAGWSLNRNAVTFGLNLSIKGVGLMLSGGARSKIVGEALRKALSDAGLDVFIMPQVGIDCDKLWAGKRSEQEYASDPACSSISVWVGSHP